ncbi:protein-disulfide reductase [Rhodoferax sp. TH121]|uniref:protein-disulfide reductase DsbD family protein n=1 Tax=Rhodoferax sp. TH121 TaxID=2022803 RepID=UPI000B973D09|nr:thioredoxin family protein [Rhodoferax sp. TH121]OYQ43097.1 protein-disulfide reductase [Rhodoferax sp. TH121]
MTLFSVRPLRPALWRARIALFLIAICAISTGARAQFESKTGAATAVVQTEQVRAELLAYAPQGVAPGAQVWLGLQLQHQPQWHTYWKNPGDSGLPTTLAWTLPPGVMAGDIAWPTPHKIAIGSLANLGFEGTVLLPVPLTVAPDFRSSGLSQDLEVRVSASWLVCRQECIPQDGEFALRLPLRGSTALHRASFEAAWAAAPKPFAGTVQATVSDTGMALRVSGLPASWRGKALNAYPETHELLHTPALPGEGDNVTTGVAAQAGTQGWQDGEWSVQVPHSAQRYTSPTTMAWVLTQGKESLRAEAAVQGIWPATAARAEVPAALQAALAANAQQAQTTAPAMPGGLLWVLATALLGGLILNLMPCVFPVLAIKVLGFATQSTQSRTAQRAQGLAYTAGVVLSFLALGGLLLALRAGGEQLGWGFQLQTPGVVAALALLFTLIALNLAGWLNVGSVLPQRLATLQLRHPVAEAFLSGVLAVAVASPCTAPFMGASLGYAITLPGAQALAIFAALGLGLALPYLLASWVPAVARWLPKPGAWMDTLRQFLAFPMAATVVWLVWVLGHLSGVDGAASLLLLIVGLCMLVWSLGLRGRSRPAFATISIAICAVFMGATAQYGLNQEPSAAATAAAPKATDWQPWAPERVQATLAQGQPVFVDFTAAWCITCQVNKKTTLSHADVQADFAAKRVMLLRADWTRRDPTITQALQALGRSGVPVYVLYAPGKAPVVLSEILTPGELRRAIATL